MVTEAHMIFIKPTKIQSLHGSGALFTHFIPLSISNLSKAQKTLLAFFIKYIFLVVYWYVNQNIDNKDLTVSAAKCIDNNDDVVYWCDEDLLLIIDMIVTAVKSIDNNDDSGLLLL